MKLNCLNTAVSLLLSVASIGAIAQPQITREQVKAELREAIRTGHIADGEDGRTRYERNPSAYPAHAVVVGKTRDEVKAELFEAIRTGDITDGSYEGLTRYERYPGAYPAHTVVAGKTRDQVKAELAEAIRTGDIALGESSLKLNEQHPGRYPKAASPTLPSQASVHAAGPLVQNPQLR
jgi:ribosomal protein L30E